MEKLKIVDRNDYYVLEPEEEKPVFVTESVAKNWPPMPKLKYLNLGEVIHKSQGFRTASKFSFNQIAYRCPNVTQFLVKAETFSDQDVQCIAENWPNLKFLKLEWLDVGTFTHYMSQMISIHCKKLKRLTLESPRELCAIKDVFWQFDLYAAIPTLREIRVNNKFDCINTGTTLKDFCGRSSKEAQLEFAEDRESSYSYHGRSVFRSSSEESNSPGCSEYEMTTEDEEY